MPTKDQISDKIPPSEEEALKARRRLLAEQKPQVVDKRRFTGGSTAKDAGEFFMEALELVGNASFSPSSDPSKPVGMDFSSAIKQVLEGKRVTRLNWGNPEIYLLMFMFGNINARVPTGKYLTIHHADGAMHPLYISDGDMLGDDWVVVV